jgi:Spy/CpxP family protein refolding chaperone
LNRLARKLAVGAGFALLCTVAGVALAQGPPGPPAQVQQMTAPARAKKLAEPMDDFAGLKFTDDQQAKIHKIREDFQNRLDVVLKDEKLSPEQKGAMLQGFKHMERGEIYKVLTAEQQVEVRKRILARREVARQEQEKEKQAAAH